MKIQVFIKTLQGGTIAIDCDESESVKSLKYKITQREGIPTDNFSLSFLSKLLDLKCTLNSYKINKCSTLVMSLPIKGGSNYNTWFPKGVFQSASRYTISSDPMAMWEDFNIDLNRNVVSQKTFAWTLTTLGNVIDGLEREMDQINARLRIDPPFFGDVQREHIKNSVKWTYILLVENNKTGEGLGKPLPDSETFMSYEDAISLFRYPKSWKTLDENAALDLNDSYKYSNFIFDSMSSAKLEENRVRLLNQKKNELKTKKKQMTAHEESKLKAEIEILKNQSLYLDSYFNIIKQIKIGLENRQDLIKSLKIVGQFAFVSFIDNLKSIYKEQIEKVDCFDLILKGLQRSNGIKGLTFELQSSSSMDEQHENVCKVLFEFSSNENLRSHLKYLDLSCMYLSSGCLNALLSIIQNVELKHVGLNYCGLSNSYLEKICNALSESNIQSVELQHNSIGDGTMKMVLTKLTSCKKLLRLDISHNPFGNKCKDEIKKLIFDKELKSLNISHSLVVRDGLSEVLITALSSSLEYINIEENREAVSGYNMKGIWTFLCCNFCRSWPKGKDSKICLWCFNHCKTHTHKVETVLPSQLENAKKINDRAKRAAQKRQLDINIEEFLGYKSVLRQEELERLRALKRREEEEIRRKKEEEERKLQEEREFLLKKAELRSSKSVGITLNTNTFGSETKMITQNNMQDILPLIEAAVKPKAIEGPKNENSENGKKEDKIDEEGSDENASLEESEGEEHKRKRRHKHRKLSSDQDGSEENIILEESEEEVYNHKHKHRRRQSSRGSTDQEGSERVMMVEESEISEPEEID